MSTDYIHELQLENERLRKALAAAREFVADETTTRWQVETLAVIDAALADSNWCKRP